MRKHKLYLLLMACLFVLTLLFAVACGNTPNEEQPAPQEEQGSEKRKLSISVCYDHYSLDIAVERFKAIHPDVEIELNSYDNDIEKYRQQVFAQLMSGKSADVLDATGFYDISIYDSGLLADFYPLMKNDPDFKEADYYTNVLDGLAYKGKLFQFPAFFAYALIGVNNTFAPELVDKFKQYDKITYQEILNLYESMADKGNRFACKNIDAITAIAANFNAFVDVENKTCSFNTPEFIELIKSAKNATSPTKISSGELGYSFSSSIYQKSELEEQALQYLFLHIYSDNYQFFVPGGGDEKFTHFIPLVDKNGKAILSPSKQFFISETADNKELAWEFIKFLTTAESSEIVLSGIAVDKAVYRKYIAVEVESLVEFLLREEYDIDMGVARAIVQVMEALETYNEMPMASVKYIGADIIPGLLLPLMQSFYNGVMTAEQVASELQNKISLILME